MTIPSSTYRLQVNRSFTLDDATQLIGYLSELGVGGVYLSPILQSTTGSDHGYDTTDVSRVDQDRGGAEALVELLISARSWARRDHRHRAEPSRHCCSDRESSLVGRAAARPGLPYASWFDIDWSRGSSRCTDPG